METPWAEDVEAVARMISKAIDDDEAYWDQWEGLAWNICKTLGAAARLAGKVEGMEETASIADECRRQNGPLAKRQAGDAYHDGIMAGAEAIAAAIRASVAQLQATATDSASHSSEAVSARPQPSEEPSA